MSLDRKEKRRAEGRRYYHANKSKFAERNKRWIANNRSKHLEYQRNYHRAKGYSKEDYLRKRAVVNSLKDVPCPDCRGKFPTICMHFDHVRGEKLFDIGAGFSYPLKKILAEIAKCDVVCGNCHAIRTYNREQHLPRRKGKALEEPPQFGFGF